MLNHGVTVRVAYQLQNIHVDDFRLQGVKPVGSGCIPGFEHEIDNLNSDKLPGVIAWTDGTPVHARFHSDLEHYGHGDMLTQTVKDACLTTQDILSFVRR